MQRMSDLGVNVILGERLDLSSVPTSALNTAEEHVLRTLSGREIRAGLVVLCCATCEKFVTDLPSSCCAQVRSQIPNYFATFSPTPSLQMAREKGISELTELCKSQPRRQAARTKHLLSIHIFLQSETLQMHSERSKQVTMLIIR